MPIDLLLVAASLFIWGFGEGMFTYFQPIYLQQLGADPIAIGGILGGVGVSMAIAQIPAGYISDRIGPLPVMRASWVMGVLAVGLMAISGSITTFVVGMLLYGITAFVNAPMNSYLSSARGSWSVERALTIPSAFFNLGTVLGPFLGGLVADQYGIRRIYPITAGLFTLSTLVLLFARPVKASQHHESTASQPGLFHNPRFLTFVGLMAVTTFATYMPQPLTPNFLQNQAHLPLRAIGQMGSVGNLGNALIVLSMGSLRAPLGFIIGQGLVGLFALFMWQGTSIAWFAVGYFFVGGFRLMRAMGAAYARSFIRAAETGLAFGVLETANAIMIILAPLVAGILYQSNPRSVYAVSLAVIILVVLLSIVSRRWIGRPTGAPAELEPGTAVLKEPEGTSPP